MSGKSALHKGLQARNQLISPSKSGVEPSTSIAMRVARKIRTPLSRSLFVLSRLSILPARFVLPFMARALSFSKGRASKVHLLCQLC